MRRENSRSEAARKAKGQGALVYKDEFIRLLVVATLVLCLGCFFIIAIPIYYGVLSQETPLGSSRYEYSTYPAMPQIAAKELTKSPPEAHSSDAQQDLKAEAQPLTSTNALPYDGGKKPVHQVYDEKPQGILLIPLQAVVEGFTCK